MKTVVIFGGAGFVGRHIITSIANEGYNIIVPYQKNTNEAKLRLLGVLGQVIPLKFTQINEDIILSILKKAHVVINLKTLWNEKKISYEKGIFNFNRDLLGLINKYNSKTLFIFFSGLGLDNMKESKRSLVISKTEQIIQKNLKKTIIIRPGIIIGGRDEFLKKLVPIFRLSYFVPIFGSGNTRIQPVFIGDVILAINKIIYKNFEESKIFELGGPNEFTYNNLYFLIAKYLGFKRFFVKIPFFFAKIIVFVIEKTPISLITFDQLMLFKNDNILSGKNNNFADLNIKPQSIEEIIKISVKNI